MNDNIELRAEILKCSLILEDTVTSLIKSYFFVDKEKPKALSNKSGAISFKNKIDLLFDFDIINEEENKCLNKLMEFRNQFMHNLNCNSFDDAIRILNNGGEKFLLSFVPDYEKSLSNEEQYLNGFQKCFLTAHQRLIEKFEKRNADIQFNANILKELNGKTITVIDTCFDVFNKIIKETSLTLSQNKVDEKTANEILSNIEKRISEIEHEPYTMNKDTIMRILK